jgi:hypothetical protein
MPQAVADGRADDGAPGHPDEGTWDLQRAPGLPKRLDQDPRTVVGVGAEHTGAELEVERQDAIAQPAHRNPLRVGSDALGRTRGVSCDRGEREQTDGEGETGEHGHGLPRARRRGVRRDLSGWCGCI